MADWKWQPHKRSIASACELASITANFPPASRISAKNPCRSSDSGVVLARDICPAEYGTQWSQTFQSSRRTRAARSRLERSWWFFRWCQSPRLTEETSRDAQKSSPLRSPDSCGFPAREPTQHLRLNLLGRGIRWRWQPRRVQSPREYTGCRLLWRRARQKTGCPLRPYAN